jgi:hypothetical protein
LKIKPAPVPISRFTLPLQTGHFLTGSSSMD